uniref:Aryl hydrocarbon receptor-like n=1 Tax=Fundulus heteroclitus TaxID=8078 RepID=A0A3Q2QD33_FUNHE
MSVNPGTYANKKRKKPVLKQKKMADSNEVVKSNPSKRHRDRLNGELDRLMELLPFPDEIRSRLDKLSVLRLSVGYLRVKSYFKGKQPHHPIVVIVKLLYRFETQLLLLAPVNITLLIPADQAVVPFSPQSDVVHQSVFELIHTDDRAMFREQLHFALNPPPVASDAEFSQGCAKAVMYNPEQLPPDSSSFLERSFVCRFRCLLDNSSGFLALKFHGRLKYLQGQNLCKDIETCKKVQLALFAIAMPVQPPSIVEIRAKMLLFQTRHKLDFTPTGVDTRGKAILGYTEIELCMKGSGYQFIHAADMMYCADNHIRSMFSPRTSSLHYRSVLPKQSYALKLGSAIFPEVFPKSLFEYNAEGEEYLRQRRLQLPFSCATGEAILYNTGPTMDISQLKFNKMFESEDTKKDMLPTSLLDCFLRHDETIYTQTVDTPLPVDRVFMDSHALVSVGSNEWQESNSAAGPMLVKEETKQSVVAVIDSLEKLTQGGEFEDVLGNLDIDDAELMEWESCFKRLHQEEDPQRSAGSDLDNFITDEIVDFIDSVFKERGEGCLNSLTSGCLKELNMSSSELCEPQLFQTQSPDCSYSPANGCYARAGETLNRESAPIASRNQKVSHQGSPIDSSMPPLQQLQLQDIFSPAIELPQLSVPNISVNASFPANLSCHQVSIGPASSSQSGYGQAQQLVQPGSHLGAPGLTGAGRTLQSSAPHMSSTAPGVKNLLPPKSSHSSVPSTVTAGYHPEFLQKGVMFENYSAPLQQRLPHAGMVQNGHDPMGTAQSQHVGNQTFPHASFCPSSVSRHKQMELGGPAGSQAAPSSSCMFEQHFPSLPAGGNILSPCGAPDFNGANVSLGPSPHQASRYSQWSSSELPMGTSAINQEIATIRPLTAAPSMAPAEDSCAMHHYLDNNLQTQSSRVSSQGRGLFISPALMK